ncbi:MAG: ferritin [Candidatus Zixiibacteriota bacterium]
MISKKMQDAFNDQIAAEFSSAHLYLSMAAYLYSIDLPGFANWMRVQYQEEVFHGMKMFDYVVERDGRAIIKTWPAPESEWKGPLDVFEAVYKHEQKVTSLIINLVEIAQAEKDHASQIFLQWYVNEQVEEEASANALIQQLKMIGDSRAALFQIDRELAQRTFSAPSETE